MTHPIWLVTIAPTANMHTTLPREYFCDSEIFAQETAAIFRQSWVAVGRASELQDVGCFRTVHVEGFDLLLVRTAEGVRCFQNTCRHRGAKLIDQAVGTLTANCIVCPYHAWKYGCDGRLLGAPNMQEADEFNTSQYGLHELPCTSWLGFTMVSLDPNLRDLSTAYEKLAEQFVPWQIEELETAATIHYSVDANWKLVAQNYSECYHCPTVHPALHRLTNYRNASNDLVSGPFLGGPMQLNEGCETMSVDGLRVGHWLPHLDEQQRREVYYYVLFPNLLVSLHPDYVMAHRLHRVAVNHTHIICEFYFRSESLAEDSFTADRATSFWDEVNRQDWRVCQLSQQGVNNPGYVPGPYSPYETMLVAFDQHYLSRLKAR